MVASAAEAWRAQHPATAAPGSSRRCPGPLESPDPGRCCVGLLRQLPRLGRAVHAGALVAGVSHDAFVRNSLMDTYAKCGWLPEARCLCDETPRRTLVAWNCMLVAHGRSAQVEEPVVLFNAMRRAGVMPSERTLVGVLSSCGDSMSARTLGLCGYGISMKLGLEADLLLSSSVLTMLVRCNQLEAARFLFDGMNKKSGYVDRDIIWLCARRGLCESV